MIKTKVILELQIDGEERQKIIDCLVINHIRHNFYDFSIGSIGGEVKIKQSEVKG